MARKETKELRIRLIGEHLSHSYSRSIHAALADYDYELQELKRSEVEAYLREADFDGLNVTAPYKQTVIPTLTRLSDTAARIGAVNTVVKEENGDLVGYNTDYEGLWELVNDLGVPPKGKKALVLGSGGASRTAVAVLGDMGAKPVVISREGEHNYSNLENHADAALIVNATPVGMYPNNGAAPLSLARFERLEGVIDLIYNPSRTALLLEAEARGIPCRNGLLMLAAQARRAAELFTGKKIEKTKSKEIAEALSRRVQNIVLIGMPGCGKTTLGKILAEDLGRTFADSDAVIEAHANMPIPDIFGAEGEAGFRARESAVLRDLGREKGLVIATGGGCVTVAKNYPYLHQNAKIVFLDAAPEGLSTEGRPLSAARSPEVLYRERLPLYRQFADVSVKITRDVAQNIQSIKEALK